MLSKTSFYIVLMLATSIASAQQSEVVLTPDQDASLFEEGPLSNGGGDYLFAGLINTGARRRALLRFPVDSIPSDATITAVELILSLSRTRTPFTAPTVSLHRMTSDWNGGSVDAPGQEGIGAAAQAGDATWDFRVFPNQSWLATGGDFEPTASASSVVMDLGSYQWNSATMVDDVLTWRDNPGQNYGWIILASENGERGNAKRFDSVDIDDASRRPQLRVTFTSVIAPLPPARAVPALSAAGWFCLLLALIGTTCWRAPSLRRR